MSWLGKVIGGAFGFLMGGPLGALLGASIGHQFDEGLDKTAWDETLSPGDQHRVQMAFFAATFSVMGHVAKSDGRVSEEEIRLASKIMDELGLSKDMRQTAIRLFEQGKDPSFPLFEALDQLRRECHRRTHLIRMFIEIQIQAAYAEGVLNPTEEQLLQTICNRLGVSNFEYQRLKLQFQAQQRFYNQHSQYHTPAKPQNNLNDAYAVLGVSRSDDETTIKKAYRRLMSQHHPDKLVAKGLPEEMMVVAKEKTQKIRKAYELIKEARGW